MGHLADEEQIKKLIASHEALQHSFQLIQSENQTLKPQLDWFKNQLFGQKSEKRLIEDNPQQLSLGESILPTSTPATNDTESIHYTRKKSKKDFRQDSVNDKGLRFSADVPVQEIHLSAPELEGDQADDYTVISEKVSYRLAQRPGSYVVLKYIRPVVKQKSTQTIASPAIPAAIIEKSYADVSLIAGVMIDKFMYHLPLYRQHQRLGQTSITVSRGWLTQLLQRAGPLLKPIYQVQWRSILQSQTIAMDETTIKAGRRQKGKMNKGYFWPLYGDRDEVVFPYGESRSYRHVEELLAGYQGVLLSDGYAAYECYAKKTKGITHAQCWVHMRRQFLEAQSLEPQQVKIILDGIANLYRHEDIIRQQCLKEDEILRYRGQHCQGLVDQFFKHLQTQAEVVALLPPDDYTRALQYALKRQDALSVYLSHPAVVMDTNHLERALRVIPMGRKNWLFCWSEAGADITGIIQSLLVTCKLHQVNPYDYLVDVLQRIDHILPGLFMN